MSDFAVDDPMGDFRDPWGAPDYGMQINDEIRKCIVFLGVLDGTGEFAPYGTGFVAHWVQAGLRFPYLVTARHVLDDMRASKRPLVARLNGNDGLAKIGTIDADSWKGHPTEPKCDIVVTHFNASRDTFDFLALTLFQTLS